MANTPLISSHIVKHLITLTFSMIITLVMYPAWAQEPMAWNDEPVFNTFSIVAVDPQTGESGVVVTSRVPCVGNAVTWVRAGVGAVATQGRTRLEYGDDLLDLLENGVDPQTAMDRVVAADNDNEHRQVGVIDMNGHSAQWTGRQQYRAVEMGDYVAMRTGENYAVQGNALFTTDVVDAVADSFENSEGQHRHLADRMIEAIYSGQQLGGDFRHGTKQSAAVLVADPRDGMSIRQDKVTVDISVCEHPQPVQELRRIYDTISQTLGFRDLRQYKGNDILQLKVILHALGYYRPEDGVALTDPTMLFYDAEAMDAVNHFRLDQKLSIAEPGFVDTRTLELLWNELEKAGLAETVREDLNEVVRVRR